MMHLNFMRRVAVRAPVVMQRTFSSTAQTGQTAGESTAKTNRVRFDHVLEGAAPR
jgi:hypothetical protein